MKHSLWSFYIDQPNYFYSLKNVWVEQICKLVYVMKSLINFNTKSIQIWFTKFIIP